MPVSPEGRKRQLENLVQNNPKFTPEQRHEIVVGAAKKRAEQIKAAKTQRDILKTILSLRCDDTEVCNELIAMGMSPNYANAANLAVMRKAVHGDIEAMRYVRDTIGEKPTEQTQLNVLSTPVKALDMTKLSDEELEYLADRSDYSDDE